MIIRRSRALANDHPEGPASCKWLSGGTGQLQIIFQRCRPLANDQPLSCHPSHLCQDPDSISRTFLEYLFLLYIRLHAIGSIIQKAMRFIGLSSSYDIFHMFTFDHYFLFHYVIFSLFGKIHLGAVWDIQQPHFLSGATPTSALSRTKDYLGLSEEQVIVSFYIILTIIDSSSCNL